MQNLRLLFLFLTLTGLLFLLIGMAKPWLMLWWEVTQNRKKVLKVYGFLTLFFYLAYLALSLILPQQYQ
ncbi:MAG: hypothetical protein OJF59_001061 [Cytophagales bacterium]|jgi:hypothetical protein|nr:hypothetical protein [Bacteroidota bacterium]MBS1979945.1 hypothetical protein [Bacteroidota bacterium]WHZ07308.1 MAG: hypothetical protein OJF59_001061 [Cytophagales bacterium]